MSGRDRTAHDGLVSRLEQEQEQYTLDRFLKQIDRAHLLICDELGYVTMSRGGQGERMTAALLDRLCHHCHIFEMNGASYWFRESMKTKKGRESE